MKHHDEHNGDHLICVYSENDEFRSVLAYGVYMLLYVTVRECVFVYIPSSIIHFVCLAAL